MKKLSKSQMTFLGLVGAGTMILASVSSGTAGDAGGCGMEKTAAACPMSKTIAAETPDTPATEAILVSSEGAAAKAASCPMSAKVAETSAAACGMKAQVADKDCSGGACAMSGADIAVYIKADGSLYVNEWKASREKLGKVLASTETPAEGEEAAAKTVLLEAAEGTDTAVVDEIRQMITEAGANIVEPQAAPGEDKVAAVNVER